MIYFLFSVIAFFVIVAFAARIKFFSEPIEYAIKEGDPIIVGLGIMIAMAFAMLWPFLVLGVLVFYPTKFVWKLAHKK